MPALRRLLLGSGPQQALPPAAVLATAFALGLALALPAFGQIRLPDASEQPPLTPAQLRYDALRAYRDGRYTEALSFAAAIPADPDVLMLRGRALAALGRYDEAAAAFLPVAAREPSGEAAFELGRLHLLRGRSTEATRVLEPVIAAAARSDVGETIGRAARAAQLLARFEQANSLFRDAAALIGDDPRCRSRGASSSSKNRIVPRPCDRFAQRSRAIGGTPRRTPGSRGPLPTRTLPWPKSSPNARWA